ncbi:MAG: hypothetical protein OEM81_05980 [Acidimicrobiia bacterium]|nr:hypothetical protein [Acidimicrobiia bacterium]
MPIRSEAAQTADEEVGLWAGLSLRWRDISWDDLAATEADVVRFHDPRQELLRRAGAWGYELGRGDLADLARFAGALAGAETEAWRHDEPHVATQALEHRKFLVGDRIVHWAVPYLDAVGRCYPELRERAHDDRDLLLGLGDAMRLAPALVGHEGVAVPGEDSLGPIDIPAPPRERLLSVWSGLVILRATLASMLGRPLSGRHLKEAWMSDPGFRADLATLYDVAGRRWFRLAQSYPGTSRLWLDLSDRARRTSAGFAPVPFSRR